MNEIKGVKLIVRAYTKEGYHKDILVQSDRQVHIHDYRVVARAGFVGMFVDPKDFPEMVHFEVILETVKE